jgi:hypothetical protein
MSDPFAAGMHALPISAEDQALFQGFGMWADAALRMRSDERGIPTGVGIGVLTAIVRGPCDDPFWEIRTAPETAGLSPGATELFASAALLFALARVMREVENAQAFRDAVDQQAEMSASLDGGIA